MRSLPGNIDVQGSFGGGKIAIKGGVGVKGTTVQINAEGPDVSVFGPYIRLPVPAGGPYALSVKAATQRNAFKVDVTTLKGYEPGVGKQDLSFFTPAYLNQFDGLMIMANGDIGMTPVQKKAIVDFVKSGKGFVGVHCSTVMMYDFPFPFSGQNSLASATTRSSPT